jgi:hypothetical protein
VLAVHGVGELGRALDQVNEGALRQVDALRDQMRPDPIKGHKQAELHRDEPCEEPTVVEGGSQGIGGMGATLERLHSGAAQTTWSRRIVRTRT